MAKKFSHKVRKQNPIPKIYDIQIFCFVTKKLGVGG